MHPLKCYHKLGVFNWVKPTQAFSHSLTYPHSTHKTIHTNKTIHNPINSPVNNSVVPASITLLLSLHATPQQQHHRERLKQHTQQHNTHKQYNNTTTHKRTCYSHHYSPTTLTTYKTMNQLSKCPLHLKYIIIKQYN